MSFKSTKTWLASPGSLVEKPVHCAQLLCDCCLLRLGGDLGATARVLSAVQNDVYTTGVMMQSQKSQRNSLLPFGATQFYSMNYFSSGFIFLLWCGRPASYVPRGQLYCSCICNCDWIERLWFICDFATGWWFGCDCATTSNYAQWRRHVISHCPVVQVAATCWIPIQRWIYGFLCAVSRVRLSNVSKY
jgi:hypothetical protein